MAYSARRIGIVLLVLGVGIVVFASTFVARQQKDFKNQSPQEFNTGFQVQSGFENKVEFGSLLSDKKENLVVLWATWCEPCVVELREIEKHKKEIQEKYELILVSLDGGEPLRAIPEVKAWLISQGLTLETYFDFDENLMKVFGIAAIPFSFGVNPEKKIIWQNSGILNLKKIL